MFRRLLVSLCLLLTLAATAHDKNTDHKTKAAYRAERPDPKPVSAPLSATPAGDYYRPCNQARQQGESDLCAQWHAANAADQSAHWAQRQFWLSIIGFAGLLVTLILNWFSTRAATGTLQAQIAAERPLLQLSMIAVAPTAQSTDALLELSLEWHLTNYGRTGAWIECANIVVEDRHDEHKISGVERVFNAFIAPGKPFGYKSEGSEWIFSKKETKIVKAQKCVYVWGYSVYHDSGGRRWKTGFAGIVRLNDTLAGTGFSPQALSEHWFDTRIAADRMAWRRRLQATCSKYLAKLKR